jgi:protein-S-isoprenylcysteine O-methyltransferase Ste14
MRILPPIWFAIGLVAIPVLHRYLPLVQLIPAPWHYAGVAIVIAGFALGGWAAALFRRADTTLVPGQESAAFVASGPFRLTRNPMYLGMAIVLFGASVFAGSLSPFAVVPAFMIIIQRLFISAEEAMMMKKFGGEFAAYRAKVRRWL